MSAGAAAEGPSLLCRSVSGDDGVVEYWAGNPSVEIIHGHITICPAWGAGAAGSQAAHVAADDTSELPTSASPPLPLTGSVVLATSVPCYMSAPEFCDFVGAFAGETHRLFRHCRVLHGRNPEEYLIALWLVSSEAAAAFVEQHDGKRYNNIEAGECRLRQVLGCYRKGLADMDRACSPSPAGALTIKRAASSNASAAGNTPGSMVRAPVAHRAVPGSCRPTSGPSPSSPPILRAPSPNNVPGLHLERPHLEWEGSLASTGLAFEGEEDLFRSCIQSSGGDGSPDNLLCAVCLEQIEVNPGGYQLSEFGGGVPLTILCGHTFHSRCLSRWCDSTCPVCRFQQNPHQTSCCDVCGQSEGIFICLVCSFIGCITSADGQGHALQHFEATSHAYALEVSTQRVWDYAGNGYVHRLLYNHEDGKMVEHSAPPGSPARGGADFGGGVGSMDFGMMSAADAEEADDDELCGSTGLARDEAWQPGAKKQESVVAEFNALLAAQMTAQRRYFEERQRDQEKQHALELEQVEAERDKAAAAAAGVERQLADVLEASRALERDIADVVASEEVMRRQLQQLEVVNQRIAEKQKVYEQKADTTRQKQQAAKRSRTQEVEELQQQIREMEFFLQSRKKLGTSTDEADLQGSHMLVMESERGRGRGGRRGRRR